MYHFVVIEQKLRSILDTLRPGLQGDELKDAQEFLDAGEFGLALETLVAVVIEDKKPIPMASFQSIEELANLMKLPPDEIRLKTLRALVF